MHPQIGIDHARLPDGAGPLVSEIAQHHANFFTGVLAALIAESGHVGALGGYPFPALTRQPETFHLGRAAGSSK